MRQFPNLGFHSGKVPAIFYEKIGAEAFLPTLPGKAAMGSAVASFQLLLICPVFLFKGLHFNGEFFV
jgi:hypothetical protein